MVITLNSYDTTIKFIRSNLLGEVLTLVCPQNCRAGCIIDIKVMKNQNQGRYVQIELDDSTDHNYPFAFTWILLEVVLFILITLSYSLNPYIEQRISSSCQIFNAKTTQPVHALYYFLYDGISSSPSTCKNTDTDFW